MMMAETFFLTEKNKMLASRPVMPGAFLSAFQEGARTRLVKLEYPSRQNEEWKYTDLKSLLAFYPFEQAL